jgi:hypothetical protein
MPGEWTEALFNSGLFVFATLQEAQNFEYCNRSQGYQIWACECQGPLPTRNSYPWDARPCEISDFWEQDYKTLGGLATPPFGTELFRKVKLTTIQAKKRYLQDVDQISQDHPTCPQSRPLRQGSKRPHDKGELV